MEENRLIGNSKSAIDILGREWKFDCIGCSIANHEITTPGGLIYEDDIFTIQQDPEVPINGFVIINVKKHINSITALNDNERIKLVELMNRVITYLKELGVTEQVTIVQEERSKHLHIWIFPYHSWMDEKYGKGVSYLRDICEYAQNNNNQNLISEILTTVKELQIKFNS